MKKLAEKRDTLESVIDDAKIRLSFLEHALDITSGGIHELNNPQRTAIWMVLNETIKDMEALQAKQSTV